jgi:hypothetical protein
MTDERRRHGCGLPQGRNLDPRPQWHVQSAGVYFQGTIARLCSVTKIT